jgi:hypothetical protein
MPCVYSGVQHNTAETKNKEIGVRKVRAQRAGMLSGPTDKYLIKNNPLSLIFDHTHASNNLHKE